MNESRKKYYNALFIVAAIYDWILGAAFLFFYKPIFESLGIAIPANPSYISLAAAFVFVSGFIYYFAFKTPAASRELIKLGAIYKFFYVAVGVYYLLISMLPHAIFFVFGVADFAFMVLFIEFIFYTKKQEVLS